MTDDITPDLPNASDLDLRELWDLFAPRYITTCLRREDFLDHLRKMVSDPDVIDEEVRFCENCYAPEWDEELHSGKGGEVSICEGCFNDWDDCSYCEDRYPPGDMNPTMGGGAVCDSCLGDHYTWCSECDGYYNDEDSSDHDHDDHDGCCESPQIKFTVRNDGCEALANDTRVTIGLPSGVISREGIKAIRLYLNNRNIYIYMEDLAKLGDQWQTGQGNFAKRLSRYVYKAYDIKLTPEVMSQVGCIARDHSAAVSVQVEVTRDLNQSAAHFYHEDSCWWGSYAESRCALKTNGGFGLLSFNSYGVSGRAWVMPLRVNEYRRLAPTFETMTPDAFVVFNGYGELSGYAAPRIMAHMAGWTYRKIEFGVPVMWINAGGYIVAPEDLAERQHASGNITLSLSQHSDLFYQENKETVSVA